MVGTSGAAGGALKGARGPSATPARTAVAATGNGDAGHGKPKRGRLGIRVILVYIFVGLPILAGLTYRF